MTDEELIARLRAGPGHDRREAADRIEALVKERDEALEWLSASQGYIADAVLALDKQEAAEAKVEKLVKVLRAAATYENRDAYHEERAIAPWYEQACAAIFEIEGDQK